MPQGLATPTYERLAQRETPVASDALARTRLAPELLPLVAGDARCAAPDGRVEVKVVLARADARIEAALRRAGLAIRTSAQGWVVGRVSVEKLLDLAELDGVARVELP